MKPKEVINRIELLKEKFNEHRKKNKKKLFVEIISQLKNVVVISIFLFSIIVLLTLFYSAGYLNYWSWYLPTFSIGTIILFLTINYKNPDKLKRFLDKSQKEIFLDFSGLFLMICLEILLLAVAILSLFVGYSILAKIFFFVMCSIPILVYYLFLQNISNNRKSENKIRIRIVSIVTILLAFIGIQAVTPIFFPKISLSMDMNTIHGWVEGKETYTGKYSTLEVYPALFPIPIDSNLYNCQDFPVGIKIREAIPRKFILPLTITIVPGIYGLNTSIRLCTQVADAWMWNKISVPIYIESIQTINYHISDSNITILHHLDEPNTDYYESLSFSNYDDFNISIVEPVFHLYNDTDAWRNTRGKNCSLAVYYTENLTTFSIIGGGANMSFYFGPKMNNDSLEIKLYNILLKPEETKEGYLVFDIYHCQNNDLILSI